MFYRFLIFVIVAILLHSCNTLYNTRIIKIDVIVPGKAILPPEYKRVAFAYNNMNTSFNPNFSYYFEDDMKIEEPSTTDSIAANIYYDVFMSHLENYEFFDTVIKIKSTGSNNISWSDSLIRAKWNSPDLNDSGSFVNANYELAKFGSFFNLFSGEIPQKDTIKFIDPNLGLYSKQQITEVADSTNADLLFSLDYFASLDGIFTPQNPGIESGILKPDYNIFPESNFSSEIVFILAYWNIYNLRDTALIWSSNKIDTITWDEMAVNIKQAKRELPPRTDAVYNAADIAGSRLAEYLSPHWITVDRMYYRSGHYELKTTDALVKQDRWLEAAKIWKKNTTNSNKNIAAKSMFNMALACEMNGEMDAAIDWAVKSFYVFGSKNQVHAFNCQEYIRILAQRKQDIQKIEI